MSKPNFTPGPWRVDVCWPNLYVRHDGPGWPLADPLSGDFPSGAAANVGSGFHPHEMRLANAYLIATAPEMYEELVAMCKAIECAEFKEDCERIGKLLKKARGEE
jgi:hypothetical protein